MPATIHLLATFIADLFKSPRRLEVENLFLRHQLNIALRGAPHRPRLRGSDRALLVWMAWLWPSLLGLSRVVEPDTILRWHRAGFRAYWRWKSRGRPGRPRVNRELRELIQRMSKENPLWGAPRIHGELLKLGFEIAESTVSTYMIRRRGPPSQTWRTFLCNHAEAIAAIDLCVVPTLTFECLFAFLVLGHGRRQLLWFAVTRHPTAEWLAQQIVEAFPWGTAPAYLVRDNDRAYGQAVTRRLRTMGIRDRPISPRSPWQNAYVERLIGTLRRECLDVLIFGERHLRRILALYSSYYNQTRSCPRIRNHHGHTNSVWIASSLRADMIFKKDRGTFLRNHMPHIAAMDLFVVPTIGFIQLYVLVIVRLARRELVLINVTAHPTAEWIAQQITEAFPWHEAPRYLISDRDGIYGAAITRRLRAMGIRDKPIAAGSPWQNGYVERLIGTIRRECLDHMIVFGEAHLRRILGKYAAYYNESRIHRSLDKDTPFHRVMEHVGAITSQPVLGGLHHQYCRI